MKKSVLYSVLMLMSISVMSQNWIYVNGTVTDSVSGNPVPDHEVTVFSDSLNGVYYYNVVMTDSAGYYFDDVPVLPNNTGIIYVRTVDCNNNPHYGQIAYNPANDTYTQDFQICTVYVLPCEAAFIFYTDSSNIPPFNYHFIDQSSGNPASWYWDFGDGGSSTEQYPFHTYPGPGTFDACLVIIGTICADTTCQTIVISDTVYQQIYGQVFAGNFPLQQGYVQLYIMNPNIGYTPFGEAAQLDSNGVYYFTLVPDGTYLIQAVPCDSINYLPTYYGDVINWQEATQVTLGVPGNPYNIDLVQAGLMTPGPGSVSGQINNGQLERTSIDRIIMILMNENTEAIGFSRVNSSGNFNYAALDYGIYYVRGELSGVSSDNMKFEITAEKPHVDIILTFSGNSILGVDDPDIDREVFSVYPNPVSEQLNISMIISQSTNVEIGLYTLTGQNVHRIMQSADAGLLKIAIPVKDLPAGLYTLRILTDKGMNVVKKVVRAR